MKLLENQYQSFEVITLNTVSFCLFLCYIRSTIKIMKDRNQVLDWIDKMIFLIQFARIIVLSLEFYIFDTRLMYATDRSLNLINNVIIVAVYLNILIQQQQQLNNIRFIMKIIFLFIFLLWYYLGVIDDSSYIFNCIGMYWLIFSSAELIISVIQVICGGLTVQQFRNNSKEQDNDNQMINQINETSEKLQSVILLTTANTVTSFLFFIRDYLAFKNIQEEEQCRTYFQSYDEKSFNHIFPVRLLTSFLGPISIYYIFYWQNRKVIITMAFTPGRNMEVFYDKRSNLINEIDGDQGNLE